MSTPDFLKSFLYFYEKIIPKALSSPDFCEEGFTNAFLWADFCEKLYGKLDEKNLKKLEERFTAYTEKFQTDGNLEQCTTILCHAFLQNPCIERNSLKTVLSRIKPTYSSFSEIWEDAVEFDSLSVKLIESLKPIVFKESDRSLYYEVKSELFVDFLKDLTDQVVTERESETHFTLLFETLCNSEDGMVVLLNVLVHSNLQGSDIQAFANHWVLLKLLEDKSCRLARFLWKRPPSELRAVAVNYAAFYSYYLDFLTKSVSSMHSVFDDGVQGWKAKKITACGVLLSYDEVVEHFRVLTSNQDDIARDSFACLGTMARRETESAIWKDIFSAIT